jgi:1,4-alpha-glucan branching enzyme
VSVVGDFNGWDRSHPMRRHPANGIWEISVPALGAGERYQFEIRGHSAEPLALKSGPYAFAFEAETPRTASVVANLDDSGGATRSGSVRAPGTARRACHRRLLIPRTGSRALPESLGLIDGANLRVAVGPR